MSHPSTALEPMTRSVYAPRGARPSGATSRRPSTARAWLSAVLAVGAGCGSHVTVAKTALSGAGESCEAQPDCERDLACVDLVCTAAGGGSGSGGAAAGEIGAAATGASAGGVATTASGRSGPGER